MSRWRGAESISGREAEQATAIAFERGHSLPPPGRKPWNVFWYPDFTPSPASHTVDLFDTMRSDNRQRARPLAARMRPRSLDEFIGQEHFLGEGKLLRRMLLADRLNSLIFYGPPGSGKTALAHVIANHTKSRFKPLNAVSTGTKEVRELLGPRPARALSNNPARREASART